MTRTTGRRWIVETGTAYLGTEHFTVRETFRFRLKRQAVAFVNKYAKTHCKGGTGYWHHMPIDSVRMRKAD